MAPDSLLALPAVQQRELFSEASADGVLARSIQRVAPSSPIQVRGHTDATGSASVNQTLSEQRAANVASFISTRGIAQSRLTSIGFASTRPLVLETNQDGSPNVQGRTQNRRVELVFRLP